MDLNDCEVLLAPRSVFNARILISDHQNPDLLFRNPDFLLKNVEFYNTTEELTAVDLAIAVSEARLGQRYSRMLIMADTCEAHSLAAYLTAEETPEVRCELHYKCRLLPPSLMLKMQRSWRIAPEK